MEEYELDLGATIADGKTKTLIVSRADAYSAYAVSKDIVTWDNGKSLPMPGKGEWSTRFNRNISRLFKEESLPIAYLSTVSDRIFKTELCEMFPFEVVAYGIVDPKCSYRKRNPAIPPETFLGEPVVQFHLKTSGRNYRGIALPCDDPFIAFDDSDVHIYLPGKPIEAQEPILSVTRESAPVVFPGFERLDEMIGLTKRAFLAGRRAFGKVDGSLYDVKCEYGKARRPSLSRKTLMADICDPDSLRLLVNGKRADKQPIRDGGEGAAPLQVEAYKLAVATSELL